MKTPTTFRDLWLAADREQRERWADRIGTSYAYLQKLSGGFARPSLAFAMRMKRAMPRRLDLSSLGVRVGGLQLEAADADGNIRLRRQR